MAVSLLANVAAAPVLTWQSVVMAGWPPVALLLAVELLTVGHGRTGEDRLVDPAQLGGVEVRAEVSVHLVDSGDHGTPGHLDDGASVVLGMTW